MSFNISEVGSFEPNETISQTQNPFFCCVRTPSLSSFLFCSLQCSFLASFLFSSSVLWYLWVQPFVILSLRSFIEEGCIAFLTSKYVGRLLLQFWHADFALTFTEG